MRNPRYYRPRLELLEPRLAPAFISLANQLTFSGTFSQSGTEVTFSGATVDIGAYVADTNQFQAVLEVDNGGVSWATDNNPTGDFTVSGNIRAYQTGNAPSVNLLSSLSDQSFNATQIVTNGFSFSSPQSFNAGPFTFTLNSLGIGPDPNESNASSLKIQGTLAFALSGGNPQDSISVSITGTDFLCINANGFDFGGLAISITKTFTFLGLTVQPNGLTIDFPPTGPFGTFSVYGSVNIATQSSQDLPNGGGSDPNFAIDAAATLGTSTAPGLAFSSWDVTQFNLGINGGFELGGFGVQAQQLQVSYYASNSELAITGGVALKLGGFTFTPPSRGRPGRPVWLSIRPPARCSSTG